MPAACLQRKGQFYTRNACLRACGASGANGIFSVPPAEPAGMPPFQGLRQPPGKPGAGASHRGGSPPLGHVVLLFKAVYQPHHHFPLAGRKGADVHTVLCGKAKQIIRRCAKHMAQLEQVGKRRKGNAVFPRIDGAAGHPQALCQHRLLHIALAAQLLQTLSKHMVFSPFFYAHHNLPVQQF